MANNRDLNYENIDSPYDGSSLMRGGVTDSEGTASIQTGKYGSTEERQIRSGQEFSDLWIKNWIKSRGYSPGINGFFLDGRSGRAFFSRVEVNNRSNEPAITVRKLEGEGVALSLDSSGDTALYVRQRSNTPAAKFFTTELDGSEGATIEATNEKSDGGAASFKTLEGGIPLYLARHSPESGHTEFYPLALLSGGEYDNLIKLWISDGEDPHGSLDGVIGDICFDKSAKVHICDGGQTWRDITSGLELLSDVEVPAGGATTINSGLIPTRSMYKVEVHLTDPLSGAVIPKLRFNNDSGSNYGFAGTEITGTFSSASATGIEMWKTASTAGSYFSYSVINRESEYKIVTGTGIKQNFVHVFGGGCWKNTSDGITSVQVDAGAVTINVGSRLMVYGSRD